MMEIYNDALLRFFGQIKWNGKSVPAVFAGSDRAHSQIRDWWLRERKIEISTSAGEASIPYPFMAIYREPFQEAKEMVTNGIFRISSNISEGYGFAMKSPRPVKATCQTNFYCKDRTQMEILEFQVRSLFQGNTSWIPVNFTNPKWYQPPNDIFSFAKVLGYQDLLIEEGGLSDNSTIEDNGLKQREIRFTLSFTLYGWLPHQAYMVPLAKNYVCELREASSEELLAETSLKKNENT